MNNTEHAVIIQKWFRENRKNYDWWPLDANTGSTASYNKWLNQPHIKIAEYKDKKCYLCCIF